MHLELLDVRESDRAWLDVLRRSVYQELFQKTFGGWDEARHFRHCESCWWQGGISVVEAERVRVGMIQILERHNVVEIGEIQIQPESQRRGIGSELLKEVIARTHRAGRTLEDQTRYDETR